jgi:hypothetical protein
MKHSLTLVLLTIIALQARAQYISMAANLTKVEQPVRTGKPLKIIETYTSRLQDSLFISRKVTTYNWSEKKISFTRYDKKGKLTHQVETGLDSSLKKVLSLVNISYEPNGKVQRDTFLFSYEQNGGLTSMVANFNGHVNTADFKAGTDGYPVESQISNNLGEITGIEKAVYYPEENYFAIARKVKWNGEKLLHDTLRMDDNKYSSRLDEYLLINEQGDITAHKSKGKSKWPGAEFENEYVYDNRGNWIRKTAYSTRKNKSGKKIRKQISRSEREISYYE